MREYISGGTLLSSHGIVCLNAVVVRKSSCGQVLGSHVGGSLQMSWTTERSTRCRETFVSEP
jgi:hypothetical protein